MKGQQILHDIASGTGPITAYRLHSITFPMADDDMFSSDLTDEQLSTKVACSPVRGLMLGSSDT